MSELTASPWSTDQITARSSTYRLLARLWQREVDEDLLRVLRTPPLRETFMAVGGVLPEEGSATIDQLAIDYCQLFLGPKDHLPPFQSVWEAGRLDGESAVSMKQFCEVVGFETSGFSGIPLDHLGVQLDVMAHILAIISESHRERLEPLQEIGRGYFGKHLRWTADLLAAAEAKATTDFYRSLAVVTRQFLDLEKGA